VSENTGNTIDINKIIANLAQKMITDTTTSLIGKGKRLFKDLTGEVRLKLESSYKDYLGCVYERYSKAKSFLIRDEATRLYDFYVPLGISCGNKVSEEASIFNFTVKNSFAVIKGGAGSGKSMMMRHLFLNTIEKQEKIPIFIELRRLNDFEGSILDYIKNALTENKFTLDDDFIDKALKAGHFAIFLDGFDEIAISRHKQIVKEIQKLTRDYDKNIIIVSSRPDDEFSSWNLFDVWEISPLNLDQALKLIRKVPSKNIDEETRDKFLKDLEKDLFEKHKSFLSNPLLLSIMVITYASSGDVPQKISTFYENAYIALFERHDALKGAFKRDRRCSLDILEFKKIFSAFSALTSSNFIYDERKVFSPNVALRFPKTEALDYVEKAKEISDVTTDFGTDDFLQDCIKAVCLLVEDGLEITFAHRSFQEYFTALFISNLDDTETQKELINTYFVGRGREIIDLLFEVDPSLVEKLLLIPGIELLEKEIGFQKKVTVLNYKTFLRICFRELHFDLHPHKEVGIYIKIFPAMEGNVYLMNAIYAFVVRNYTLLRGFGIIEEENKESLISLLNLSSTKSSRAYKISDVCKNAKLFQLLMKDETWGISINKLKAVLEIKEKLVAKHKQIQSARKENLLKGLRKRK